MNTHRIQEVLAACATAAALVACDPPASRPPPPPAECGPRTPAPDGAAFEDVEAVPFGEVKSNVMLLVDRSSTMGNTGVCSASSCPTKWEQLLALGPYLEAIAPHTRLGLTVYPAPGFGACGVDDTGILVPLSEAPGTDQEILAALETTVPGGSTPTADALLHLAGSGELSDPNRNNVIVLLTDGRPTCACGIGERDCERDAAVAAVEALRYQSDPPIKVYVIGFGTAAVEEAHDTLTAMAVAAGSDRGIEGEPAYHQAETVEELIRRAQEVAQELRDPCAFHLCDRPEPDRMVAAVDGVELEPCVDASCESGFVYDHGEGQIRFVGHACDAIADGTAKELWFGERQ